jgi:hypothetical protein
MWSKISAPAGETPWAIKPDREAGQSPRTRPWTLLWISAGVALATLAVRFMFFEGLWGSDDLVHVQFAMDWNRLPANHWESRLLYNALLRLAIQTVGMNEIAYALPGLLASMIMVACSVWCAGCCAGSRAAVSAGLIASSLPVDIIYSTVPTAMSLSAGLAALGTLLLLLGNRTYTKVIASVTLALAILAHLSAFFYVSALICGLCFTAQGWPERWRTIGYWAVIVVLSAVLELGLFVIITGDPLYEFRLVGQKHLLSEDLMTPSHQNFKWYIWPLRDWLFSKEFGVAIFCGCVWAFSTWRRLPARLQALAVTIVVFWIWNGYGTHSPTSYLPLRVTRFAYTLAMPTAVLLGCLVATPSRVGAWVFAANVGIGLLLVASSGSWGQKLEITREFMPYIQAHPEVLFLADAPTRNEILVLNHGKDLANVVTWDEGPPDTDRPVAVLVNPLHKEKRPEGLNLGKAIYVTEPAYRRLAILFPEERVKRHAWFVRRPQGQICLLAEKDTED